MYDIPVADGQTEVGPVIVPGVVGSLLNGSVLAIEFPQALDAITDKVPLVNPEGTLKLMLVPLSIKMLQPAGGVQI